MQFMWNENLWLIALVLAGLSSGGCLWLWIRLSGLNRGLNLLREQVGKYAELEAKFTEQWSAGFANVQQALEKELENRIDEDLLSKFEDDSANFDAILLALNKLKQNLSDLTRDEVQNRTHQLHLALINRLNLMAVTVEKMGDETPGLKQLKYSLDECKTEFNEAGYEIPVLLNQTYREGLKLEVNFVNSDQLPEGTRTITQVQKPTVLFKGQLLQQGRVTVTQHCGTA